jgi:DMSO/TMAO reductase YedYZ molybdopterin-dependent catalytic subunit
MINKENCHPCGPRGNPSTSTESDAETAKPRTVAPDDAEDTVPVVAETSEASEAGGPPSSPVEHALQADEAADSVAVKQETADAGSETAAPPPPKPIANSGTVEIVELLDDAEGSPPFLAADERRKDEAASSVAAKSISMATQKSFFQEQPPTIIEAAPWVLRYRTRREVLLFGAGALATMAGAGLLLPQPTLGRLGVQRDINPRGKEWLLNKAVRIDDDVAEALYSANRMVPTYTKSQITPIKNNYNGVTPDPGYISEWNLTLEGLDSDLNVRLDIRKLMNRFPIHEQITRFVCVEGWTAIAWWAGFRFDDLLRAYPPTSQAKWARVESSVNLDNSGNPDPYFVSVDLATARHPQTLLVTHHNGQLLTVEHGAPLRLLVPVKLGLKNVKAITRITYSAEEPKDYWTQYGYSSYDGI